MRSLHYYADYDYQKIFYASTLQQGMEKNKFQQKLGKHIVNLRREKGLSQVQFGYLIEMEKQNVNRLENGKTNPTAYTLQKIAIALEIPLSKIFDFE